MEMENVPSRIVAVLAMVAVGLVLFAVSLVFRQKDLEQDDYTT